MVVARRLRPPDTAAETSRLRHRSSPEHIQMQLDLNPTIAAGVVAATAATDALYVMFTAAVIARRPMSAANWSAAWYVASSFAVISYTSNAVYVLFAALGSWIGAYVSLRWFRR
jgi:hypothetical protein